MFSELVNISNYRAKKLWKIKDCKVEKNVFFLIWKSQ